MNALGRDLHFAKMHGLGNDFVVLDLRDTYDPHPGLCRFLADHHQGVGCDLIPLRVDEFGAGETLACGSGACAAVATLMRRSRIARHVTVRLADGNLAVNWPDLTAEITMPVQRPLHFEGSVPTSIVATLEGSVSDPFTQNFHIF